MNRTIIFSILTCLTGLCNNVFSADLEHLELRADRAKIDELWDTLGDETPAGRAEADRLFRSGEVGRTPLHIACANCDYKEVKRLIDAGASVHAQEYGTNKTPLCSLVDDLLPGQDLEVAVEIIKLLASNGAKVDAVYNDFRNVLQAETITPLHKASQLGLANIVEVLLQVGADVNYQDVRFGCSALHYAQRNNNVSRPQRFREAKRIVTWDTPLTWDVPLIRLISLYGPENIQRQITNVASQLSYPSVLPGSDAVVEILLDYGANPSLANKYDTKALYSCGLGPQIPQSSLFDREILCINDFDKAELDDEKASIGQLRTKLRKFNPSGVDRETAAKYAPEE